MEVQRWFVRLGVVVLAAGGLVAEAEAGPPLRRDLGSYFLFAQRSVSGKNFRLLSPCNIGVNCEQPSANSSCGVMGFEDAFFADGSQIAADKATFNKEFADAWQVFVNKGAPFPRLLVRDPPIQTFALPIIPDTCAPGCKPNDAALGALCGMPVPFPACASGKPVTVNDGGDCNPASADAATGNGRCDLKPGAWGDVKVKNEAEIRFVGGTYDVCAFTMGRRAIASAAAPTVLNVAQGELRFGNDSKFGAQCGDFKVFVQGTNTISFGRGGSVAAMICAPSGQIALGNDKSLLGSFVADTITSDRGNEGRCCGGGCTCFDDFSPTEARVGDVITFTSRCDLNEVVAIRICGTTATILTKTAGTLTATVPGVAPGACMVEAESAAGVFKAFGTLAVTP
jgi:hypothetical protein